VGLLAEELLVVPLAHAVLCMGGAIALFVLHATSSREVRTSDLPRLLLPPPEFLELISVEEGYHLLSSSRNYGPVAERQLELAHG